MLKKHIRISQWVLAGVLIYAVFVSILFLRMKIAESMLADYSEARLCQSSANCRETVSAKILDYGSKNISFVNLGPKGIPMESGTFEEYQFTLSIENAEPMSVKVMPESPSDARGFDVANIYIPTKSDKALINSDLINGKTVFVEVWRNRITFILLSLPVIDQVNAAPPQEGISIGPREQETHELSLPTENHPVVRAELAKKDFNGWTGGILLLAIGPVVFGSVAISLIYGIDWLVRKVLKGRARNN